MTRIYLSIVGLLYLALAVWCSVSPEQTSGKVGFELANDSGRSEFLTVYGGLEFGLALIFLTPLLRRDMEAFSLLSCLFAHGSLVAFRSLSFVLFRDISSMTFKLAAGEWAILICGLTIWLTRKSRVTEPAVSVDD